MSLLPTSPFSENRLHLFQRSFLVLFRYLYQVSKIPSRVVEGMMNPCHGSQTCRYGLMLKTGRSNFASRNFSYYCFSRRLLRVQPVNYTLCYKLLNNVIFYILYYTNKTIPEIYWYFTYICIYAVPVTFFRYIIYYQILFKFIIYKSSIFWVSFTYFISFTYINIRCNKK